MAIDSKICQHEATEIRRRGPHACRQCLDCGRRVGDWLPKPSNFGALPPFDTDLESAWARQRQSEVAAARQAEAAARRETTEAKRRAYSEYLASPAWSTKRSAVLRRAGGVCEGCGASRPTEVHHLTYAHVGDELLFELVALCRACHERAHSNKQQEAAA